MDLFITLESSVDISPISPAISFLLASKLNPKNSNPFKLSLLTKAAFSPIPAVNTITSIPPIAPAYAAI